MKAKVLTLLFAAAVMVFVMAPDWRDPSLRPRMVVLSPVLLALFLIILSPRARAFIWRHRRAIRGAGILLCLSFVGAVAAIFTWAPSLFPPPDTSRENGISGAVVGLLFAGVLLIGLPTITRRQVTAVEVQTSQVRKPEPVRTRIPFAGLAQGAGAAAYVLLHPGALLRTVGPWILAAGILSALVLQVDAYTVGLVPSVLIPDFTDPLSQHGAAVVPLLFLVWFIGVAAACVAWHRHLLAPDVPLPGIWVLVQRCRSYLSPLIYGGIVVVMPVVLFGRYAPIIAGLLHHADVGAVRLLIEISVAPFTLVLISGFALLGPAVAMDDAAFGAVKAAAYARRMGTSYWLGVLLAVLPFALAIAVLYDLGYPNPVWELRSVFFDAADLVLALMAGIAALTYWSRAYQTVKAVIEAESEGGEPPVAA